MDSHDDQSLATAATAAPGQLEIHAVDEALAAAGARRCNDSDTITASNDDLSQEEGNNEEITPPIDMKGNEETIHEEIEGDIVIGNEEKRHDEIDANIVIQVAPPPVLGGQETYPGACRIIPVNLGNTEGDPTTTPAVSLSEARSSALNALTNDEEAGSLTSAGHCQQPDDVDDQLDRLGVHRVEAEAVPVEDVDIAYAKPIKTVNVFGKEIQSTNLKWLACLSLIAIISIVTPAAIAVANRKDDNPAELVEQSNNDSPKKHQGRGRIFDIIFPISPAVAINDPTSPQKQAIHWMVSEDDFPYNNTGRADRWIQERYILAVIWFDTGGATWTRDGGIVGWDDHCNSTEMIVCNDDSHVVELSFGNSNLSGTIPSEIQHLSLQRLSLEKNEYLGGTLPQFNVVDLQRLWVQETNVTGSLDFPSQSCEGGDFMADLKNVDCECCVCCD